MQASTYVATQKVKVAEILIKDRVNDAAVEDSDAEFIVKRLKSMLAIVEKEVRIDLCRKRISFKPKRSIIMRKSSCKE